MDRIIILLVVLLAFCQSASGFEIKDTESSMSDNVRGFLTSESDPTVSGAISSHAADANAHHTPTVDTDTHLTAPEITAMGFVSEETDPTVNDLGKVSLPCSNGQIPKMTAGLWACGSDESGGSGTGANSVEVAISTTGAGVAGDVVFINQFAITEAGILCRESGSIVFDLWVDSLQNVPPTVEDSITASAKPTLTDAYYATDQTLTGWTTTISANSAMRINVDSLSGVTYCTLILHGAWQ